MDPKTLHALRASIAHWKENEQVTDIDDAKTGARHCALCVLFFDFPNDCKGCPVKEKTGKNNCRDTPYYQTVDSKNDSDLEAFRLAAKAEREFLESLLPPDTP